MNNECHSKNIMIRNSLFMILVLFHYSRFKKFLANRLTKKKNEIIIKLIHSGGQVMIPNLPALEQLRNMDYPEFVAFCQDNPSLLQTPLHELETHFGITGVKTYGETSPLYQPENPAPTLKLRREEVEGFLASLARWT